MAHEEHILSALIGCTDDVIVVMDPDGTIRRCNERATQVCGHAPDDLVGQTLATLVHDAHTSRLTRLIRHAADGHASEPTDLSVRAKDGRLMDLEMRFAPVRSESQQVVGLLALGRDVTDQKRSERDLRRHWDQVVESAVEGIVVINEAGRVEAVNGAMTTLFGYTADEMIGRSVNMLMPKPYSDEHDRYMARYLETGEQRVIGIGREVTARRADGTTFPLHLSVGETHVNGGRLFTGVLHDLTRRVEMEARVRDATTLGRLSEMAALLAHELRNPLAAVRGAIETLGRRMGPGTDEATVAREVLNRVDEMVGLLKELVIFADPPRLTREPVDLRRLIDAAVALLHEDPALATVQFQITGGASTLFADPAVLRIVLLNLFSNASHAMGGKGNVRVSVTEAPAWCEVSIGDDGTGIADAVRERLYTPFVTTKSRGAGLGLLIARRFVEAHGGTMAIESPRGGGTVVTLRLPLSDAAAGV